MKILFVGDVMLGRTVNAVLKHNHYSYPWGNTRPVLKSADFKICNLECVISDVGQPWPKKAFNFRTDPKNIEVLEIANFSPVSLANNHSLDFGAQALEQSLNILKQNLVNFAGAGVDSIEASMPAIENGEKNLLGMIAFTDNNPDWEAKESSPGIFYVPINLEDPRAKNLFRLVKKTKKRVGILIVSAHWGPNWGYEPPKEHINFAHALIDAGADIIYGHSPHVFRGIEIYKGKPILYSTGNFIDDYGIDEIERNDQSFIFIVEVDPPGFHKITLYPTMIRNCQAVLADDENLEAEAIALRMMDLCKKLHTSIIWNSEDKFLEVHFYEALSDN